MVLVRHARYISTPELRSGVCSSHADPERAVPSIDVPSLTVHLASLVVVSTALQVCSEAEFDHS